MSIYNVIDSKVVDYAEIVVLFFENCNLSCVFCSQDHKSTDFMTKEDIVSKSNDIIKWINENDRSQYFKLHLMGGELLQNDLINNGYLEYYSEFMDRVRSAIPKEKEIVFNFVTNLVFTETQKVKDFLDKYNLKVSASYDTNGRFNRSEEQIFRNNIETMKPYIEMISLTMTKPNILSITKGNEYFDYLYSQFLCGWDFYLPVTKEKNVLTPKESELLAFYKVLIEKYPKCINVEHFTNGSKYNKMGCTRGNSLVVMTDGTTPKGCSGTVLMKDKDVDDSTDFVVINFFKKYDCFQCEFYNRCSFTCFVKDNYSQTIRDTKECIYKEAFKFADSLHQPTPR